jgi:hypothetical protein
LFVRFQGNTNSKRKSHSDENDGAPFRAGFDNPRARTYCAQIRASRRPPGHLRPHQLTKGASDTPLAGARFPRLSWCRSFNGTADDHRRGPRNPPRHVGRPGELRRGLRAAWEPSFGSRSTSPASVITRRSASAARTRVTAGCDLNGDRERPPRSDCYPRSPRSGFHFLDEMRSVVVCGLGPRDSMTLVCRCIAELPSDSIACKT